MQIRETFLRLLRSENIREEKRELKYCNFFIISLLYLSGLVADLAQSGRATES